MLQYCQLGEFHLSNTTDLSLVRRTFFSVTHPYPTGPHLDPGSYIKIPALQTLWAIRRRDCEEKRKKKRKGGIILLNYRWPPRIITHQGQHGRRDPCRTAFRDFLPGK
ncbi:hypothetical protein CEXT_35731 [Caerostris extrusa]|uniref:Uncharacterized protein n=1 Tax=Caerostris extrusa TaxID=172846 RepID=A0AAV4P1T7_CAEEX|nr:hypothetical protein CEXT_35731 [Caerostris extrusa]